jgi:hypothetical protein
MTDIIITGICIVVLIINCVFFTLKKNFLMLLINQIMFLYECFLLAMLTYIYYTG